MTQFKNYFFLGLVFTFFSIYEIKADQNFTNSHIQNPSHYLNHDVWIAIQNYLLPDNHPVKEILDHIFTSSRAFCNLKTMKEAGFFDAEPQHHTHILVTSHPLLKGYVIKAYLDEQKYHFGIPEHYYWIKRVKGARLIKESIMKHGYENFFKVPNKWIYILPDEPSPPSKTLRKKCILVEEDMNLFSNKKNKKLWGSKKVTIELLDALYSVATEVGMFDCTKPDNCSFSKDGKAAFVDTQSFNRKKIMFTKLTPFLSPKMQKYWRNKTKTNEEA